MRRSPGRIADGGEVAHERGMVAEPGAPPIVRVGARNGSKPADDHMVETPSALIIGEGPARLSLAVAVQAAEGVDPAVVAPQTVDERSLGAVPALPALGAKAPGPVVGEGDDLAVGGLAAGGVEVAAEDRRRGVLGSGGPRQPPAAAAP